MTLSPVKVLHVRALALIPKLVPLYKAILIFIYLQNLPKLLKIDESTNVVLFVKPSFHFDNLRGKYFDFICHVIVIAVVIIPSLFTDSKQIV